MSNNFSRRFFAGADAIGNADSAVRAAGEGEGGKLAQRSLDSFNERFVADVGLRHGVWVAPDTRENRRGADSEQICEFVTDIFLHRRIVSVEQLRLQRATDKGAK